MSKPIAVRFLKAWRNYFKGDEAVFPAEDAQQLVDGDVAEPIGSTKARSAAKKPVAKGGEPDPNANPNPGGGDDPDPDNDDEKP